MTEAPHPHPSTGSRRCLYELWVVMQLGLRLDLCTDEGVLNVMPRMTPGGRQVAETLLQLARDAFPTRITYAVAVKTCAMLSTLLLTTTMLTPLAVPTVLALANTEKVVAHAMPIATMHAMP